MQVMNTLMQGACSLIDISIREITKKREFQYG